MRHTLKEYYNTYNPNIIQIVYGEHIVNIDTRVSGSYALMRTFENIKYYFKSCNDSCLILDYVNE
jgi:hypothetical protein